MKCLLSLCLILFSVVAQAAPNIDALALAAIQNDISDTGKASVIVEFEPLNNIGYAIGKLHGATLKSAIDRVRVDFLSSLSPRAAAAIVSQYAYTSGLLAQVDQQQLVEFSNSRYVKAIYQNKARKASLAESLNLVYSTRDKPRAENGSGQMIAVLDSGIDKTHDFFITNGTSRVLSEACYSGAGGGARPEASSLCPNGELQSTLNGSGTDCDGFLSCQHGTHIAGIAAGNGGVASGANLLSIQIFTALRNVADPAVCGVVGGSCIRAYDSDILAALERVYVLRNTFPIAAVNISAGGGQFTSSCDSENGLITSAIAQLKNAGVSTVAAAGNNGFNDAISWPACISDVLSVGASSDFTGTLLGQPAVIDQRVFYSNLSTELDIYAPGSFIYSSLPGNRFGDLKGTSVATPHVAGAIAIMKQIRPNAPPSQLKSVLKGVGPQVAANGIVRRRLDITQAIARLKSAFLPSIVLLLLDD